MGIILTIFKNASRKRLRDSDSKADTDNSPDDSEFRGFPLSVDTDQEWEGGTLASHSHNKMTTFSTTDAGPLHEKMANYTNFLCSEFQKTVDSLNENLQKLQTGSDPGCVAKTVDTFFDRFDHHMKQITKNFRDQKIANFSKVDRSARILIGSSASIGANKLAGECIGLSKFYERKDLQGCQRIQQQIHAEYFLVKRELKALVQTIRR